MIWEEDSKIFRLPASIETPDNDNDNDNCSGLITFLSHPTETSQYLYFYIIDILFAYQVMVADWDKTGNHDDRMNTVCRSKNIAYLSSDPQHSPLGNLEPPRNTFTHRFLEELGSLCFEV